MTIGKESIAYVGKGIRVSIPSAQPTEGGATKYDTGKARWDLLPYDSLEEVTKVFSFGATKYGDRNWEQGFNWMRLVGSLMRHVSAYVRGEDKDPESGLHHMAHAACNVLFLLTFSIRGVGKDDRASLDQHKKKD